MRCSAPAAMLCIFLALTAEVAAAEPTEAAGAEARVIARPARNPNWKPLWDDQGSYDVSLRPARSALRGCPRADSWACACRR